jgi:HSP20 family protein
MALFPDPFETLPGLQQALDTFRTSGWLQPGLSGGGTYPPINVFRKGDDFIVITEVPGIKRSDIEVQVKGNTIRLAGTKSVTYGEEVSLHRRERLAGRFDRAVSGCDTPHRDQSGGGEGGMSRRRASAVLAACRA